MQRSPVPIRRDWRQRVEALGFEFHTLDGPYWVEDACFRFDQVEIDRLESAGNELHAMCLDAVADIVRTGDYARLGDSVVLVASPWNFPYAIPAGGVCAALAAGNAVLLKPAPEVRAVGLALAEQLWRAGVPRAVAGP